MTNAVKKIVRSYFGKTDVSIDGLLEIFEKTGNAYLALDLLMGTYEKPTIPQKSVWAGQTCTFDSYDKWKDDIHFTYEDFATQAIYVDRSVDPKTLTPDNYKEFEKSYKDVNIKMVTVRTSHEKVTKSLYVSLKEWMDGVDKLQKENQKES